MAPELRKLLTIIAHRGLHQYTRLPFGVSAAPTITQRVLDAVLSSLPGVSAYPDDIIATKDWVDNLYNRLKTVIQHVILDYACLKKSADFSRINLSTQGLSLMLTAVTLTQEASRRFSKCPYQRTSLLSGQFLA